MTSTKVPDETKSDAQQMREAANAVWDLARSYDFVTKKFLKYVAGQIHAEASKLEVEEGK